MENIVKSNYENAIKNYRFNEKIKKLNILILTFDYPPLKGGISVYSYEVAKSFVEKGHNVIIVTHKSPNTASYEYNGNIKVYRIEENKFLGHKDPIMMFRMIVLIRRLITQEKVDIIFNMSFFFGGIITKLINKVPVVLKHDESSFVKMASKARYNLIYYIILRYLFSHPACFIASSNELANLPQIFSVQKNKIKLITNGVDIKRFNPKINGNKIRKKYFISKKELLILCPRRFDPKCGVEYFIKAIPLVVSKIKKIKFIILGGGYLDQKKRFLEIIKQDKTKDYIIFGGYVDNEQMPEFYAASDIVVLPSLIEATSIAGLEAMASGKPLIGTMVGGIPLLIDDSINGFLIKPKNQKEIADAIIKLRNKDIRIKMGAKSREKVVNNFSWDKISSELLDVFYRIINNKFYK